MHPFLSIRCDLGRIKGGEIKGRKQHFPPPTSGHLSTWPVRQAPKEEFSRAKVAIYDIQVVFPLFNQGHFLKTGLFQNSG